MDDIIPELRAVLAVPSGTDAERAANVGRFIETAEALKKVLERPDGVDIALLNTNAVFAVPGTRQALLSAVRRWAAWADVTENALFYAVLATFWVALGAGGSASIAEADVLAPLCAAATDRMGAWGTAMIAGARICSTIACVVNALQNAPGGYGAPSELLASFACLVLALFHDRPEAFPAVTNEATLAILRLRDMAPEGGVTIVQAATHALGAHCFTGDAAAVLLEHIRNALAAPLVPMAVAGHCYKPVLKAVEQWAAHPGVQTHGLSSLFNMTSNIPVRKAMAHGSAIVVRTLRAAVAALRRHPDEFPVVQAALRALWQPCSNPWGIEAHTGPMMLTEGAAAAVVDALTRYMRRTVPSPGATLPRDYSLLVLACQLVTLWVRHPAVAAGLPRVPGFTDLFHGLCWVFAEPGDGVDLGREAVGGGSCIGVPGVPAPPEGLKVVLGGLLGPMSNNAPAGAAGEDARAFALRAMDLLG